MNLRKLQMMSKGAVLRNPNGARGNPFGGDSGGSNANNIFNQAAQQQQQQQQQPQGQHMPNGMPQTPPSASVPGQQSAQGVPPNSPNQPQGAVNREGSSPLDNWAQKFNNSNNGEGGDGAPQQQQQGGNQSGTNAGNGNNNPQQPSSVFDYKFEDFQGQYSKQDFASGITEDQVNKVIRDGDVNEFRNILNSVAANAASMATFGAARISKTGIDEFNGRFEQELPNKLRDHQISTMWQNSQDAIMTNPAMRPMVESVTSMMRQQFPEASAQELQTYVQDYMKDVASHITGSMVNSNSAAKENENSGKRDMSSLFEF